MKDISDVLSATLQQWRCTESHWFQDVAVHLKLSLARGVRQVFGAMQVRADPES